MVRGPCAFKQRDVTRAVKATLAAGVPVARVEISKDGTIIVVTEKTPDEPRGDEPSHNEWDDAL